MSPFPGSWSKLSNGKVDTEFKILKSNYTLEDHNLDIGLIVSDKKNLKIAVNKGFIEILELQIAGKKRMKSIDLLNGYKFEENAKAL